MKILIVAKKFPYPLTEGEPIAINYLAKSMAALGCSIDLMVLNTSKHYFDPKDFPSEHNIFEDIFSVKVDNSITVLGAMKSMLSGTPYILDRFISVELEKKLAEVLKHKRYDVVQFETIYLAHYIKTVRNHSQSLLALRAHNVEHFIWDRVATNTRNLVKKWYLMNQNTYLKKFETEKLNEFDVLLAITTEDLGNFRQLGYSNEGLAVPVGLNLKDYPLSDEVEQDAFSIAFIGALDWMPNQHGILWFLDNVWRVFHQENPMVAFHIAGKNTPAWLSSVPRKGVVFHGQVPDAKLFIRSHPVIVAPLFSGSGIKIKVLEGMALGKTVITTSIGAEGIPGENGRHFLLADSAPDFLEKLNWSMDNPVDAKRIGTEGRKLIQSKFDNLEIAQSVKTVYETCLNHSKSIKKAL